MAEERRSRAGGPCKKAPHEQELGRIRIHVATNIPEYSLSRVQDP